jgi:hypothetical protein
MKLEERTEMIRKIRAEFLDAEEILPSGSFTIMHDLRIKTQKIIIESIKIL